MQFREATRGDRDAILALRRRCFGDVDPEKCEPAFWEWEFGDARTFVGELDGQIVTHVALVNVPYAIDDDVVRGTMAVDAMTAPEARGRGAFAGVIAFAVRTVETISTAYQIRPAVLGAMLRGGYVAAAKVPVLVHPLIFGGRRADVRPLSRDDAAWMAEIAQPLTNCVARTRAFVEWRFFDNPFWKYEAFALGDAYAVTRRTSLRGHDTLAIVDLGGTDHAAHVALIRHVIAEARALGCRFAAALVSRSHPAFKPLIARAFLPSPHAFRLLVYPAPYAQRKWRVMWADTDHL